MDYLNNLGQLPLDEPMGYGISYLGSTYYRTCYAAAG